ncbi:hypothetical protein [Lyngbya aestuarii]|uniref:hypothetical protein n=1 Tax=Lyngbya aestuarii TaxID=118322 RepID=UPI00403DCF07
MRHPFELEISELENLNLTLEDIADQDAEKVAGGSDVTTLAVGEEGGEVTTLAIGEEGGDSVFTTLAIGEEGGDSIFTTLAIGEEGGDQFPYW